jgi:lysophospholipase L1-like esterase
MRLKSLLLLSTALLLFPEASNAEDVGPVILGDSLTVSISSSLHNRIPKIEVQARSARTIRRSVLTDNGYDFLIPLQLENHPQWVIQLGTNDAWTESLPISTVISDIDKFVGRLQRMAPQGSCVAWILPYIGTPASQQLQRRSWTISRAIRTSVKRLKCGFTVDWPRIATRHPEFLEADGVHLSSKGKVRFVNLVLGALADLKGHPAASA